MFTVYLFIFYFCNRFANKTSLYWAIDSATRILIISDNAPLFSPGTVSCDIKNIFGERSKWGRQGEHDATERCAKGYDNYAVIIFVYPPQLFTITGLTPF